MQAIELRNKIEDLCAFKNIKFAKWVEEFQTYLTDKDVDTRVIQTAYQRNEKVQLRDPNPRLFKAFWHEKGIELNDAHFWMTREEFRRDFGLPAVATINDIQRILSKEKLASLGGTYQVIRPHTLHPQAYVLEAMEINVAGNELSTRFYSHHRPEEKYLYEGVGYAAKKYYFSPMFRQHEKFVDEQSYRCVSFYIGDGSCEGCISGLMLRGMTEGIDAVGLPFFAFRVPSAKSLKALERVQIVQPGPDAPRLTKLHRDGAILVGEVWEKWYKQIFGICEEIFKHPDFTKATHRGRSLLIFTTPAPILKHILDVDAEKWKSVVEKLQVRKD
jgi:hypothetical protein